MEHNKIAQVKKEQEMIDLLLKRRFESPRAIQWLRLRIVVWTLRGKIQGWLKRLLDLTICVVTIPLILPLFLFLYAAIRLDSEGPAFFTQTRVGKWGREFTFYKFRSMYIDAEARRAALMEQNEVSGPGFKMKHDPRVTRVGRIIRKLSLDELPQIINVLKGDMSFVGPRPALPDEVAIYEFSQHRRFDTTPGITGLPQVSGRSDLEFTRWIELDLQYIQQQSVWTDLKILLKTIPAVIFSKGAY